MTKVMFCKNLNHYNNKGANVHLGNTIITKPIMRTILVPTDFSKEAENALEVAVSVARHTDATLNLLHVVESIYEDSYNTTGTSNPVEDSMDRLFVLKMVEKAMHLLNKKVAELKEEGVKAIPHIKVGNVYKHIYDVISNINVDLIIMGTHGATSTDIITGSNTGKVVRLAHCPVLCVKEKSERFYLKNIVFATDFSKESIKMVEKLTELQKFFNSTIHLVYVNTLATFQSDTDIKKRMLEFVKESKIDNYHFYIVNAYEEDEGIMQFAEDISADMIALCTHGRKGISAFILGSISQDLVKLSHKPVFTYKVTA